MSRGQSGGRGQSRSRKDGAKGTGTWIPILVAVIGAAAVLGAALIPLKFGRKATGSVQAQRFRITRIIRLDEGPGNVTGLSGPKPRPSILKLKRRDNGLYKESDPTNLWILFVVACSGYTESMHGRVDIGMTVSYVNDKYHEDSASPAYTSLSEWHEIGLTSGLNVGDPNTDLHLDETETPRFVLLNFQQGDNPYGQGGQITVTMKDNLGHETDSKSIDVDVEKG